MIELTLLSCLERYHSEVKPRRRVRVHVRILFHGRVKVGFRIYSCQI